jgi:hypothetical protein
MRVKEEGVRVMRETGRVLLLALVKMCPSEEMAHKMLSRRTT